MVNGKKALMSMFVLIMAISLCVCSSYSQDKPTEEVMKRLLIRDFIGNMEYKESGHKYNITKFNITNSFISKENGNYCIEVDYNLTGIGWENKFNGKKYSFDKKGNQWYLGTW